MAGMEALGRLFDIGTAWTAVDLNTSNAATGKRCSLQNATGVTFVASVGAEVSSTTDIVFTFNQHTASVNGTSNVLAAATVTTSRGVTKYWTKSETTLDNDEAWVETTQSDGSTVTLAAAGFAAKEKILAVYVSADQLGDGYTHLSVDVAVAALGQIEYAAGLYIVHDLNQQRKPANLPSLLKPGTANA